MFRPSRKRPEGGDRFVSWKIGLFFAGAVLALAGMGLNMNAAVWAGIAVLAVGMALRFAPRKDAPPPD